MTISAHPLSDTPFQRALACLSHPISVISIVLLLANDHIFKHNWPSWWTGKLSDFAGLIFAPFIAIALISLMFPRRDTKTGGIVATVAFVGISIIFTLLKTLPSFNMAIEALLGKILGASISIILDPTDLLALPMLLVSWRIYEKKKINARHQTGLRMLLLGGLATLATSIVSDYGLNCVTEVQGEVIVESMGSHTISKQYSSKDGGLTWENRNPISPVNCPFRAQPLTELIDPFNDSIRYRFVDYKVSRSIDRGKTWQVEFDWALISGEAANLYSRLNITDAGSSDSTAFVQSAVIHSKTGNVVAAMGYSGMLIRIVNGQWQWIGIGPYRAPELTHVIQYAVVSQLWPALLIVPLCLATAGNYLLSSSGRSFWLGCAWILWVGIVFFFTPILPSAGVSGFSMFSRIGEVYGLNYFSVLICGVITLPLMLEVLADVYEQTRRGSFILVIWALTTAWLLLIPYIVWAQNYISAHTIASTFAVILVLIMTASTHQYLRQVVKVKRKKKKTDLNKEKNAFPEEQSENLGTAQDGKQLTH